MANEKPAPCSRCYDPRGDCEDRAINRPRKLADNVKAALIVACAIRAGRSAAAADKEAGDGR